MSNLEKILEAAEHTFGTPAKALEWVMKTSATLKGTPMEIVDKPGGLTKILEHLKKISIQHGKD